MKIKWKHQRCIVCLKKDQLTKEHVIPDSLGGILTSKFLCQSCNSSFGSGFEAEARLAPELRKAASGLDESLFELNEHGALYKLQFGEYMLEGAVRRDGNIKTKKLEDGSLIAPEPDASKIIKSKMQKKGEPNSNINEALAKLESSPANTIVDLSADLSVRKWYNNPATPTYTEPSLSPLVPLKVAYEFYALLVGSMIYDPAFQRIRDVLVNEDRDLADGMVTYEWASNPMLFMELHLKVTKILHNFRYDFSDCWLIQFGFRR